MRRVVAAAGTLMQTALSLRAVPRADVALRGQAARRLSAMRALGGHTPPFRSAVGASPARHAVVARDSVASLETYSDAPPLDVVPWTKEASNTVTITGTVGALDVRRLSTGKTKATMRLAVRKPVPGAAEPETDWCAKASACASRFFANVARGCGYVALCGRGERDARGMAVADTLGLTPWTACGAPQVRRGGVERGG